MAQHLLLVRHAAVGARYSGRFIGSTDAETAGHDEERLRHLLKITRSYAPFRCVCSPMTRTLQTASLLAERLGLDVSVDADLREIDFGRWEGLTFNEISAGDPDLVERWSRWSPDFCFPRGEGVAAFAERTWRVAHRLAELPEDAVLAVTHGGVIRAVICHLLGLSQRQYLLFDVQPFSLTVIRLFGGAGVLAGMNMGLNGAGRDG